MVSISNSKSSMFTLFSQANSINELSSQISAVYLQIITVILCLNCCVSGLLLVLHKHVPLEVHCVYDSVFELLYIALNVGLRWGNTNSVSLLGLTATLLPFVGIQSKLSAILATAVRRHTAVVVLRCAEEVRPRVQDGAQPVDQNIAIAHLIRSRRVDIRDAEVGIHASNKLKTSLSVCSGLLLAAFGLAFAGFVFSTLGTVDAKCSDLYGTCVWTGVQPKIHFMENLLVKHHVVKTKSPR